MALCVNQSGTWREITTQCVKQSSTWRDISLGCINQSGTWRCYGFYNAATAISQTSIGGFVEGGYLLSRNRNNEEGYANQPAYILAPVCTEVSRNWYNRNDAITTANAHAACGDWFIFGNSFLNGTFFPGGGWDSNCSNNYWTSTEDDGRNAWWYRPSDTCRNQANKNNVFCVRAVRSVSY